MNGGDTRPAALPLSLRFIERDWLSSNQIIGIDGDRATVVDTGYPKQAARTVALVRQTLADAGAHLTRIVNTHLHSDHCGGNRALIDAFGCTVTIPHGNVDDLASWEKARRLFTVTGQDCPPFGFDDTLAPGDTLRLGGLDWDVHAAPGHDPKSLILHCARERLLISADALWPDGFGIVFSEFDGMAGFAGQDEVLALIERLEVEVVLPGHGPMFGDVVAAVARARARLEAMRRDPARHARYALKGMTKFLMLDYGRVEERWLREHLRAAPAVRHAATQAGMDYDEAFDWTISALTRQGLLAREPGQLVDVAT